MMIVYDNYLVPRPRRLGIEEKEFIGKRIIL